MPPPASSPAAESEKFTSFWTGTRKVSCCDKADKP